jgi:hypothetical protein
MDERSGRRLTGSSISTSGNGSTVIEEVDEVVLVEELEDVLGLLESLTELVDGFEDEVIVETDEDEEKLVL